MDKKFRNLLLLFTAIVVLFPIALNFLILGINCIPSVAGDEGMFQSYTSYFGGAIGGLATLITIYFTVLKIKDDHKPLIYFNNTSTYYYRNRNGVDSYFSQTYCRQDNDVKAANHEFIFEVNNVGLYPALDLQLSLTNLQVFMESVKELKVDASVYSEIEKSYSKEEEKYLVQSLFKQSTDKKMQPSWHFESFIRKFLHCYDSNNQSKKYENNNPIIKGRFKLYDICAVYGDIDGNKYRDVFSVFVRLTNLDLTSQLKQYDIWQINVEFEK